MRAEGNLKAGVYNLVIRPYEIATVEPEPALTPYEIMAFTYESATDS